MSNGSYLHLGIPRALCFGRSTVCFVCRVARALTPAPSEAQLYHGGGRRAALAPCGRCVYRLTLLLHSCVELLLKSATVRLAYARWYRGLWPARSQRAIGCVTPAERD